MSLPLRIVVAAVFLATLACTGDASPQPVEAPEISDPVSEAQRAPRAHVTPSRPAGSALQAAAPTAEASPRSGTADDTPGTPLVPDEPATSAGVVTVDRAALERDLQRVQGIDDVGGFRPKLTMRGMTGIKVASLPPTSPARRFGLQPGDVVHSVNGRELTSLGAAWAAVEQLQNADRLDGWITRDGQRQRLQVELR